MVFISLSVCHPFEVCLYVIWSGSSFHDALDHTTSYWYLIFSRFLRVFFCCTVSHHRVVCVYVICPGSSFNYSLGHTTSCWYLILGRILRVLFFIVCLPSRCSLSLFNLPLVKFSFFSGSYHFLLVFNFG